MEQQGYVAATSFSADGVAITLTPVGLAHGRLRAGACELARQVRSLHNWRGTRSEANVASEIRAHCRAWFWLPFLRKRANPIDLEFYRAWPASLMDDLARYVRGSRSRE